MNKPIEVRRKVRTPIMAMQWDGENIDAFHQWLKIPMYLSRNNSDPKRLVLSGRGHLNPGDWYVMGAGMMTDEQFRLLYDQVLVPDYAAKSTARAFGGGWQGTPQG